MSRTSDQWKSEFRERGSLWVHSGVMEQPHPILTGDMHASLYTNSRMVTRDPVLLMEIATNLSAQIIETYQFDLRKIDRVVGPQTGATDLAVALSNLFTFVRRGKGLCGWASPKKVGEGAGKKMVFDFETDPVNCVEAEETVLVCEDVITTGGTLDITIKAVIEQGGRVLPFVVALVNQSGHGEVFGCEVLSLFDRKIPLWPATECPLCNQGSEPVRPKENWSRLTAQY